MNSSDQPVKERKEVKEAVDKGARVFAFAEEDEEGMFTS